MDQNTTAISALQEYFSHFRNVRLPRIPMTEQMKLADHIERETTRIDERETTRIDGLLEKNRALHRAPERKTRGVYHSGSNR